MKAWRRAGRVVAGLAVALVALPSVAATSARADEQPSILKAYGLDWIERVRDDAWPQPKQERPVICLLDTGVAVTPDTPADDPNGPIVARLAIDGGDGFPQGTTFEHLHGTTMAAVIAAPRNDWGTVGVFPQGRIVSVRVTEGDATYITPADMRSGVLACREWMRGNGNLGLAAVVMSESNYDQRPSDTESWDATARRVDASGGVLVAAVGNAQTAALVAPVAVVGLLAVSAGADDGSLCGFAQYAPTVGLSGPGCSAQMFNGRAVWPTGSSAATAATGALVAALATKAPNLTPAERLAAVDAAAVESGGGRRIDGAAIGLTSFAGAVAPGADQMAAQPPPSAATTVSADTSPVSTTVKPVRLQRLWRPDVVARWSRGRLSVDRKDHRPIGTLQVIAGGGGNRAALSSGRRTLSKRLTWRPTRVRCWIEGGSPPGWRSLTRDVRVAEG